MDVASKLVLADVRAPEQCDVGERWCVHKSSLAGHAPLLLELLDHEEARVEETLHAVGQTAFLGPRETVSRSACDAPR